MMFIPRIWFHRRNYPFCFSWIWRIAGLFRFFFVFLILYLRQHQPLFFQTIFSFRDSFLALTFRNNGCLESLGWLFKVIVFEFTDWEAHVLFFNLCTWRASSQFTIFFVVVSALENWEYDSDSWCYSATWSTFDAEWGTSAIRCSWCLCWGS